MGVNASALLLDDYENILTDIAEDVYNRLPRTRHQRYKFRLTCKAWNRVAGMPQPARSTPCFLARAHESVVAQKGVRGPSAFSLWAPIDRMSIAERYPALTSITVRNRPSYQFLQQFERIATLPSLQSCQLCLLDLTGLACWHIFRSYVVPTSSAGHC